jgi:hypothetical protein
MLSRISLAYVAAGRTWGVWISPLVTAWLFGGLRVSIAMAMALDNVFYPKLKQTQVKRPIIIVGNPRTGTTFLQRFLADQGFGTGLQLWRMLYPSLLAQAVLKPMLPTLEKISPARHHSTVAHDTSLTSVETDDVSVFFRYFDGFFLYGFLLAWHEEDQRHLFDPSFRDTSKRDFDWLEAIWRRNMVATGQDRVIAKLFSLGPRTPKFLERFPDARILYMVRDPLEVIPSGMSLVTGVLDKRFGFWNLPEATRARYLERLYVALVELFRRFHDDYTSGHIPRDKIMIVRFDRMMQDFEGLMDEICAFVDNQPDEALRAEIKRVGEKQRKYSSEHKYDLAKFGLDAERIRRDCDFVYTTFLPQTDFAQPAPKAPGIAS